MGSTITDPLKPQTKEDNARRPPRETREVPSKPEEPGKPKED